MFTERSEQIPPRCRLTARLRERGGAGRVAFGAGASDVARDYDVSWWSVHRALVDKALTLTDTDRPGWLLGLVSGRSGAAVQTWLATQPPDWRAGIDVVSPRSTPTQAAHAGLDTRRSRSSTRLGNRSPSWDIEARQAWSS